MSKKFNLVELLKAKKRMLKSIKHSKYFNDLKVRAEINIRNESCVDIKLLPVNNQKDVKNKFFKIVTFTDKATGEIVTVSIWDGATGKSYGHKHPNSFSAEKYIEDLYDLSDNCLKYLIYILDEKWVTDRELEEKLKQSHPVTNPKAAKKAEVKSDTNSQLTKDELNFIRIQKAASTFGRKMTALQDYAAIMKTESCNLYIAKLMGDIIESFNSVTFTEYWNKHEWKKGYSGYSYNFETHFDHDQSTGEVIVSSHNKNVKISFVIHNPEDYNQPPCIDIHIHYTYDIQANRKDKADKSSSYIMLNIFDLEGTIEEHGVYDSVFKRLAERIEDNPIEKHKIENDTITFLIHLPNERILDNFHKNRIKDLCKILAKVVYTA